MTTDKPFTCISYNTIHFLMEKLTFLVENKTLRFWAFIKHRKEDYDLSDHIHMIMIPRKRIDVDSLLETFEEYKEVGQLPLKAIQPRSTVLYDGYPDEWILYVLHDSGYCLKKFLDKVYEYDYYDLVSSDDLTMQDFYRHAMTESKYVKEDRKLSLINTIDVKKSQLIRSGVLPVNMSMQLYALHRLEESEVFEERQNIRRKEKWYVIIY